MDGIVRRSQSTVLLATHSIEYVRGADQVILIDGGGRVTSQHDLDSSRLAESFLEELSKADAENEKVSTKHEVDSSRFTEEPEETKPPQQSGDFTLYSYFFASSTRRMVICCIIAIFLNNLSELSAGLFFPS
jgi:ABC-type multidrug transport system ATPase subunit